jgi:multidrug efflux pump subunit AcrB/outer membrane protein TolC
MVKKKTDIIEAAMRNRNIIVIISVLLMVFGIVALQKMPRNEFPQFTIRQGVIVGVYPGATSAEVEAQLTKVVENYIFGYQEVRKEKTTSLSREGMMYIFVEMNDNVKNADQFWSKLKHGLDELKMTLPTGVLALVTNSDFGDTVAELITLSSDTKSYKELEEQLKKLESECRRITASSKIKHYGLQKEKIYVNVKPEKLNEYNIKTLSLLGSYQMNGMVNYAGVLKDGKYNLTIHLPSNFESEKDLADQIVYSDLSGNVVRLKNIATIERRYEDPDSYIEQNGKKTILLSLEMQPGNNIVKYGKDVDKAIETFRKSCPEDIKVAKISELPKYVDDSVSNFMSEFLMAIVAVILVTILLLPLRVASVAGITVPITVLITLGILYFIGVELHTVSLSSLILVLGMIVDNSIVIIDNHVEKIDHRYSPWHAAIASAKELFIPTATATLAIMAIYIPLGLMVPGTAGEFLETFPIVVSTALIISILVATLLVPYLNFVFIKKGLKTGRNTKKGKSLLDWLQGWYNVSLEKAFKHPKFVIGTGIAFIALAIILFKNTNQQLFPELERNQFAVEVYLPTGSSLESTAQIVDSIETVLNHDKRVTNVTSFIGTSSPRFQVVYAPNMPSPNYGQLLINTVSDKATRELVNDYGAKYADHFANAHVKFKILALQMNKASIEIRISSDSVKDIRAVEMQVNDILKKTQHIAWSRTDWDQKQQNIKVTLDRDKANRMGYSKGFVSTSLMVGLNGLPLTTIWENDYPVEVRLTQENEGAKSIKTIGDQYITSLSSFSAAPLRSFASFSPEWTEGTIAHRNGTPTLTIYIDNDATGIASRMFEEIRPQIDNLKLPDRLSISYGGDYEAQGEVFVPMTIALAVSIAIIFFILLFQFKKVKLSLLIMSTMLLTLPGAAIGLKLMGYPFSITAFVGISSLCGLVVRNGIILIDYARAIRGKNKMSIHEAAIAAGKRRMRPIFLTSAAASVGVIPMIISRSPLWGPLGTVICFGLLISMVLTLYILPILYSLVYSDKEQKTGGFWSFPGKAAIMLLIISLPLISSKTEAQKALSLDSCKRIALANNKKIIKSEIDVKSAKEQHSNAFTNYFPIVSISGTAMRSSEYLMKIKTPEMNLPVYDGNPANLATASQFAYIPSLSIKALDYINTADISIALPLYMGGRIRNGNALASIGEDVSKQQKNIVITDVLIHTEELYWNLISLKGKKKTLLSYQTMLDTLYRDVNNYYTSGMVQRNDLLKVQLKQNEMKSNLLKVNNGIVMTTRALCQFIGMTYDTTLIFGEQPSVENSFPTQIENPKSAIGNRVEIKLLNKAVEAEQLQKKMSIGELMPQVSLSGMGVYYDVMNNTDKAALALVNISIPITGWWGGSHKIKQQQMKIEKAMVDRDETSELLTLQAEQAGNELTESWSQLKLSEQSVEQARENLKVTDDNYRSGVTGISDLLEAQALFQSSNDNLTDALCSYQIKKAKYLQSTGNYH